MLSYVFTLTFACNSIVALRNHSAEFGLQMISFFVEFCSIHMVFGCFSKMFGSLNVIFYSDLIFFERNGDRFWGIVFVFLHFVLAQR